MADIEHVNISEAQLHNPKGFSTADNSTVLSKNSGGTLEWVNPQEIAASAIHASIYLEDNANPTTCVAGTLVDFVAPTNNWGITDADGITISSTSQGEMTIVTAGDYMIDCEYSLLGTAGGSAVKNYQIVPSIDRGAGYPTSIGADTTRGNLKRDITGSENGAWGHSCMMTALSVGDKVKFRLLNNTDTQAAVLQDANFRLILNKAT